jgi:DNA-binding response OmpR family regulator
MIRSIVFHYFADRFSSIKIVPRMIKFFGHKIVTCKVGMEAVETHRKSWNEIDIVILDMMMPKLNGRDTFFEMRAINNYVKAVLISGFSIDGEVQRLLDAGMKGFIQKPFNMRELSKTILEAFNGKNSGG